MDRIAGGVGGESGKNGGEQDRQERSGFDQRVAGRQLAAGQVIGQDAVFDRAEQSRQRAENKDRDKQQHDRMKGEAGDGEAGGAHLDKLDALRQQRLVVAVGKFAAEPRQEEERRDDGGAGKRNQRSRIGAGDLRQNDEAERGFEETVAEGREELAKEQRRKTAARHQGFKHRSPALPFLPAGAVRLPGMTAKPRPPAV